MADDIIPGIGTEGAPVNPGELLHAERLRVGFTTEEVATHLRLSQTTLGFLEEGRFDRLPGDTFARGYVRAYARLLKLDPNRLVKEYDRYVGADQRENHVHSIDRVSATSRRGSRVAMTLSTIVVVSIMLMLGLWWWNESRDTISQPSAADASALHDLDEVQVDSMLSADQIDSHSGELTPAAPESAAAAEAEQDAVAAPDSEPAAARAVPHTDATQVAVSASSPATQNAPAAAAASAAVKEATATAGQSGLVMSFSAACWVQVSVPGGKILHSAQMQQGESLNIAHTGPLDLVLGAANAVSKIEYNGQPVELKVNRQSGVARLRLGQ